MRLSYADVFQHNTRYQLHGKIFHSMVNFLTLESENFAQEIE